MAEEQQRLRDTMPDEEIEAVQDFEACFSSDAGKRVLARLDHYCQHGQNKMGPDPQTTAHNCGKEAVYIYIKSMIEKAKNLNQPIQGEIDNG